MRESEQSKIRLKVLSQLQSQSVSVISGTLVRGNDTTAAAEPLGRHQSRAEEEDVELRVMMKKK